MGGGLWGMGTRAYVQLLPPAAKGSFDFVPQMKSSI